MTAFRSHLEFLRKTDDCCWLERPDSPSPQVIASEALRADGPVLRCTTNDARVDLVAGVYGGVDGLSRGNRFPWSRLGIGLGVDQEPEYVDVLEAITDLGDRLDEHDVTYVERAATATDPSVRELGFPTPPDGTWPRLTLGLLSVGTDDGSYWTPIHGTVLDDNTIRARVPDAITDRFARGDVVSVALGVPAEALTATYLLTVTDRLSTPIEERRVGSTVPVIPTGGGLVPSSSEVVLEAEIADQQPETRSEKREFWERIVDGTTLTLDVTSVFTRDDAVVPFTPLDVPLADDLQLVALTLAAQLYDRANSYWGIAPVEWLLLPASGRLGVCVVSTEMLYAGFEWQLSNFLFSFSNCYDTVVVVDDEASPRDLGQVLADIWVKAHPSRDWLFSESDAPVARLPTYSRDGTGARLYVDATWDPRWDEEYIAPRVSLTESYPPNLRAAIRGSWSEFGFDTDPEEL
ncbi:UbiD family decarboxylase [Natronolimnohabitans sp. A-GB9]|uniref:UbiD family decarboxylase domain-containing protein n=1 Tax=Natronolimnohabitans sp. A-GB9 TaxID=3069757 RepID=UPI0027AE167D|nr:UbiD family decarboxylase domain-containing protein [Natronolimnohabitans sp. A-GB9]MDQ2050256.1 UbiD family decarboxylase [Natronolimnohabitans sp. A-GB9]